MTTYKQTKNFSLAKMGKKAGYCLQNVRLAFGIGSKYASAKDALAGCKAAGQFHAGAAPTNVAVPVWLNTTNKYGHIMVSDHGTIYSDGKKTNVAQSKLLGWGESVNGVRVVEPVAEPAPAKKSNEEIADEVIAGKWGNGADRKKRLADAGYDYNAVQVIVDKKVKGGSSSAPRALCVGDTVKITRWVDWTNRSLRQMDGTYKIMQLAGNRAVVTRNGSVYAAISTANLARA